MRPSRASLVAALVLAVACVPQATPAQELPVRPVSAPDDRPACPGERAAPERPAEARRAEAQELAGGATEAALLGEPRRELELLREATELDPGAPELAYRRARAHDDLGETEAAIRWYCRYLAVSTGEEDEPRVRSRLSELSERSAPATDDGSLERVREGVALMERGRLEEAERRFTEALRSDSTLPEARYHRGLARGAAGRAGPAVRDLRAYLEARSDPPDRERVEAAIRFLEDPPTRFDPERALLLGALVPGAGHFYTGEPVTGGVLLGVAAAAGLGGALYERVEVACLDVPRDGVCPEDRVQSTTSTRPALGPGLATVALVAAVSAVTAHMQAVSRNAEERRLRIGQPAGGGGDERVSLRVPAPYPAPTAGGVGVALLRLRF